MNPSSLSLRKPVIAFAMFVLSAFVVFWATSLPKGFLSSTPYHAIDAVSDATLAQAVPAAPSILDGIIAKVRSKAEAQGSSFNAYVAAYLSMVDALDNSLKADPDYSTTYVYIFKYIYPRVEALKKTDASSLFSTLLGAVDKTVVVSGNVTPIDTSSGGTNTGTVVLPAPSITSIIPASGAPGTLVTVNGSGFTENSTILVDGKVFPDIPFFDSAVQCFQAPCPKTSSTIVTPTNISFVFPSQTETPCTVDRNTQTFNACDPIVEKIGSGSHQIQIVSKSGKSNGMDFAVSTGKIVSGTPTDPSALTANITVNGGQKTVTVNPGDMVTKNWSSANATSFHSTWAATGECFLDTMSGDWTAGNTANGTESYPATASQAGCTITITYTVTGAGGKTASDSVQIIHTPLPADSSALCAEQGLTNAAGEAPKDPNFANLPRYHIGANEALVMPVTVDNGDLAYGKMSTVYESSNYVVTLSKYKCDFSPEIEATRCFGITGSYMSEGGLQWMSSERNPPSYLLCRPKPGKYYLNIRNAGVDQAAYDKLVGQQLKLQRPIVDYCAYLIQRDGSALCDFSTWPALPDADFTPFAKSASVTIKNPTYTCPNGSVVSSASQCPSTTPTVPVAPDPSTTPDWGAGDGKWKLLNVVPGPRPPTCNNLVSVGGSCKVNSRCANTDGTTSMWCTTAEN